VYLGTPTDPDLCISSQWP